MTRQNSRSGGAGREESKIGDGAQQRGDLSALDGSGSIARRNLLAITASGLTALAGCTSSDSDSTETDGGSGDTDTESETETDGSDDETATASDTDTETSEETAQSAERSVSFTKPADGAEVVSPVQFALESEGFDIVDTGEQADTPAHYHILVDTDPIEEGERIPANDQHWHIGGGSATTPLTLSEGEHRLVLQPGDSQHNAYGVHDEINVTVTGSMSLEITGPESGSLQEVPVTIEVETENLELEAPGEINQGAGHLHLIVNEDDPKRLGVDIRADDYNVYHFEDGQSEIEVTEDMVPGNGSHQFLVQASNGMHEAYPVHDDIFVTLRTQT